MAQLNSSNVVNGNIVEPNDILQLYDAFTAGGGTTGAYNVSISGSLTGSATSASYALFASTASYATSSLNASKLSPLSDTNNNNRPVVFISTSSADYEQTYKANGGKFTYNPSTELLTVTSSFAITASYAANGGLADKIIQQQFERLGGGVNDATFKFICGSIQASTGIATTSAFSLLSGKTLGTNVFVTATIEASSPSSGNIVTVKTLTAGALTFNTAGGTGTEVIHYHAFILQ
jgi:hypothetical protein